jgi:release factor glutamine methyltransferase
MFYVDERVLIPRDETEILVEKAIEIIKKNKIKSICEIGIGSGAIFLSILEEFNETLEILATDIEDSALEVAIKNYQLKKYKISDKHQVKFQKNDRLHNIDQKFDLIISNPPYIKEQADLGGVHGQVHAYEPHTALYLKDDEYNQWFELFFKQVELCLNNGGYFLMEGHEDHLQEQLSIAESFNLHGDIANDYTNSNRFLFLQKKS